MAELIWSDVAVSDLEGIYNYIECDSRQYAVERRIHHSIERVRQSPESGRKVSEFRHLPYREVSINNYRIIYRHAANSDQVLIVTVVHARHLLGEGSIYKSDQGE